MGGEKKDVFVVVLRKEKRKVKKGGLRTGGGVCGKDGDVGGCGEKDPGEVAVGD